MSKAEKAAFVLAMISSDQVSIPASMAKNLAECQQWLESMTEIKLVGKSDGKKEV